MVQDAIADVRPSFVDFEDNVDLEPVGAQVGRRAARGDQAEAEGQQVACNGQHVRLVVVVDADEGTPFERQLLSRAELRLGEGGAEGLRAAHHFARALHLGPQDRVDPGKTHEREDRRFHEDARGVEVVHQPEVGKRLARHDARGHLGERHARRLRQIRHRPRRARVDLDHVDRVVLDGKLRVHQPDDVECPGDTPGVVTDRLEVPLGDEVGRDDARAVAGVDAGLLDVLHHAADDHAALAVRHAVHVEFECVLEKPVDENRTLG